MRVMACCAPELLQFIGCEFFAASYRLLPTGPDSLGMCFIERFCEHEIASHIVTLNQCDKYSQTSVLASEK